MPLHDAAGHHPVHSRNGHTANLKKPQQGAHLIKEDRRLAWDKLCHGILSTAPVRLITIVNFLNEQEACKNRKIIRQRPRTLRPMRMKRTGKIGKLGGCRNHCRDKSQAGDDSSIIMIRDTERMYVALSTAKKKPWPKKDKP